MSHHVAPDLSSFSNVEEYEGSDQLHVGNRQGFLIQSTGSASFTNHSNRNFSLNQILHVSNITKSLLFVQRFSNENNCFFEFHLVYFLVKIGIPGFSFFSIRVLMDFTSCPSSQSLHVILKLLHMQKRYPPVGIFDWVMCIDKFLSQVLSRHKLSSSSFRFHNLCMACQLGKSHKLSFPPHINKSTSFLQLIFADVWAPSPFLSSQGYCFLLVFVDDFSG